MASTKPTPLWTPSRQTIKQARITRFAEEQGRRLNRGFASYEELWEWSVQDPADFWQSIWTLGDVQADGCSDPVLASQEMPGARWFPGVQLNYAEHVLRERDPDALAVHHASELRPLEAWSWGELRKRVSAIAGGLLALGVSEGDRVVAYMPNVPETLAAMLATTAIGATWSSCSPDMGARIVTDRFAQLRPKVLLRVDGYRYGGRDFDRDSVVDQVVGEMDSLEHVVRFGYLDGSGWSPGFEDDDYELAFARVPFDHPLWVLFSSGTTGLPKAIVHGHGGILLEQLKTSLLHLDVGQNDRVFWFTTTGWMMWNFLAGVLLTAAEIVLFDGNPGYPNLGTLWDLAERSGVTVFGTSAAFITANIKAAVHPRAGRDLSALRAVGSTGSALSPEGFRWVYEQLGAHVWLFSTSGGTDVCTAFLASVPTLPVYEGELQARALGCDVQAWDEGGCSVVGATGELVIVKPMPSMPVFIWDDTDGAKYKDAYFDVYPGVWRHGDWLEITDRGTGILHGRSDATINRSGIRIGTAEIYRSVLAVEEVLDAVVVDLPREGYEDGWMPLFVVLRDGATLTPSLAARITARLRADCSARHVPNDVFQVPEIPRTASGKVPEVPIKRILMGEEPARALSVGSLANPGSLATFVTMASELQDSNAAGSA